MEMRCLRRMCGVIVMDRIRNDLIREEVGVMRDLADWVDEVEEDHAGGGWMEWYQL